MIYTCNTCGYTTKRKYNLQLHMGKKKPCKRKINTHNVNQSDFLYKDGFVEPFLENIIDGYTYTPKHRMILFMFVYHLFKAYYFIKLYSVNINKVGNYTNKSHEKVFSSKKERLDNHFTIFKCKECDKVLSSKNSLLRHEKVCKGKENLQCPKCLKYFKTKKIKKYHIDNIKCKSPSLKSEDEENADQIAINEKDLCQKIQNLEEINKLEMLKCKVKKLEKSIDDYKHFQNDESCNLKLNTNTNTNNKFTTYQKKIIASKQKWTCKNCNELLTENYEIDHIIPIVDNGTNDLQNGQALCKPCHEEKTSYETNRRNFNKFIV